MRAMELTMTQKDVCYFSLFFFVNVSSAVHSTNNAKRKKNHIIHGRHITKRVQNAYDKQKRVVFIILFALTNDPLYVSDMFLSLLLFNDQMWICVENVSVDVITICYTCIAIKSIQYLDHCDNITMNRVAGKIAQTFHVFFSRMPLAASISMPIIK